MSNAQETRLFDKSGPFADNIRLRLPGDDLTELRASMEEFGWLPEFPALKDENGTVLVGHRRLKLARELGMQPVVQVLDVGTGSEADVRRVSVAVASNIGGKPLTIKDRQHIAGELASRGWTLKNIAKVLNVSVATAGRDTAASGTSRDEKSQQKDTRGRRRSPGRQPIRNKPEQERERLLTETIRKAVTARKDIDPAGWRRPMPFPRTGLSASKGSYGSRPRLLRPSRQLRHRTARHRHRPARRPPRPPRPLCSARPTWTTC